MGFVVEPAGALFAGGGGVLFEFGAVGSVSSEGTVIGVKDLYERVVFCNRICGAKVTSNCAYLVLEVSPPPHRVKPGTGEE